MVPVIVIFTKYEAFQANVNMDMKDNGLDGVLEDECQKRLEEHYLKGIKGDYVVEGK